jgi:hypothetical protein
MGGCDTPWPCRAPLVSTYRRWYRTNGLSGSSSATHEKAEDDEHAHVGTDCGDGREYRERNEKYDVDRSPAKRF